MVLTTYYTHVLKYDKPHNLRKETPTNQPRQRVRAQSPHSWAGREIKEFPGEGCGVGGGGRRGEKALSEVVGAGASWQCLPS